MDDKRTVGLKARLDEIEQKINTFIEVPEPPKKKIDRRLNLRLRAKLKLRNLAKKNEVLVFLMNTNKNLDARAYPIENGMIKIDDKYHEVNVDQVFLWKGKFPAIVLPEWDLSPIGTEQYYEAVKGGRTVEPQNIILRAMEQSELMSKPKISGKTIIWLGLGAIVIFYVLFAQGGGG